MDSHQSGEANIFFNAETNSSEDSPITLSEKKKPTSRIGLLLNQQGQSESKSAFDEISEETEQEESYYPKEINISKKTNLLITVNFLVSVKELEQVYDIRIFSSGDSPISKLIQMAIEKFNEEEFTFNDPKTKSPLYRVQFKRENLAAYELKPCKKTGYPKYDYPPFNHRMKLAFAQTANFAILFNKDVIVLSPCSRREKSQMCKDLKCLII